MDSQKAIGFTLHLSPGFLVVLRLDQPLCYCCCSPGVGDGGNVMLIIIISLGCFAL